MSDGQGMNYIVHALVGKVPLIELQRIQKVMLCHIILAPLYKGN